MRKLLGLRKVVILTPREVGIPPISIEEGSDIEINAEQKARTYLGKTHFPILGMDSAFVISGENLDFSRVRRNALIGHDESSLNQQEISELMISFYQSLVKRRGGHVPAYWEDAFSLVSPDGMARKERCKRPVILTDEVRGNVDPCFPLRSLYIVESTGKYVIDQTSAEEWEEMRPYREALERLLQLPTA